MIGSCVHRPLSIFKQNIYGCACFWVGIAWGQGKGMEGEDQHGHRMTEKKMLFVIQEFMSCVEKWRIRWSARNQWMPWPLSYKWVVFCYTSISDMCLGGYRKINTGWLAENRKRGVGGGGGGGGDESKGWFRVAEWPRGQLGRDSSVWEKKQSYRNMQGWRRGNGTLVQKIMMAFCVLVIGLADIGGLIEQYRFTVWVKNVMLELISRPGQNPALHECVTAVEYDTCFVMHLYLKQFSHGTWMLVFLTKNSVIP